MNKKFKKIVFVLLLLCGLIFTAEAYGAPEWNNTINITSPVKSPDELVTVLSGAFDNICETLNLTINNSKHWYNFDDSSLMDECINKAVDKSLTGGPIIIAALLMKRPHNL